MAFPRTLPILMSSASGKLLERIEKKWNSEMWDLVIGRADLAIAGAVVLGPRALLKPSSEVL